MGKEDIKVSLENPTLREEAEKRLKGINQAIDLDNSEANSLKLLHELQVYQLELQIQNDELRQKQTEAEEIRQQYSDLYEYAPCGYLTLNKSGVITQANHTASSILGIDNNKLLNSRFTPLISDDFLDKFNSACLACIDTGKINSCELQLKSLHNKKWINVNCSSKRNYEGEVISTLISLNDISKNKESIEKLELSEERFRTLFEHCPEGIIITDIEIQKFRYVNPAICKMLGYSRTELQKMSVQDIHPKENIEQVMTIFKNLLEGDQHLAEDIHCIHKNNKNIYVNINVTLIEIDKRQCIVGFFTDITERKYSNKVMKEARQQFKDLVGNISEWIWEVDLNGKYTYVSPKVKNIIGYEPSEIIGRYFYDVMPKNEAERINILFKEIINEKIPIRNIENITIHKNGHHLLMETNGNPVFDSKGRLTGYRGIDRDITLKKKIYNCIKKLNELQLSLFAHDTLNNKMKIITDFIVKEFDAYFARIWVIGKADRCSSGCYHANISKGQHVCRNRDECLHLISSSGHYTHIGGDIHARVPIGAYKIGEIASGAYSSFLTNDVVNDSRIHNHAWARKHNLVSFAGFKICLPDEKAYGVLGLFSKNVISNEEKNIFDNISKMIMIVIKNIKQENEIRKYSNAVKNAYDGCIILNNKGIITYANNSALDIFDCKNNELKDIYINKLLESDTVNKHIDDLFNSGKKWSELLIKQKNKKEMALLLSIAPIKNDEGEIIAAMAILRDITDMKQLEKELFQAQKLDAIGVMAGGIAHDFNNFLATILGYTDLLLKVYKKDDSIQEYIKEIEDQAEQASNVVKQILSFSKPSDEAFKMVDIYKIIYNTTKMLRFKGQGKIDIRLKNKVDKYSKILGNETRLKQVFLNLFTNAFNAMSNDADGRLDINLNTVVLDNKNASLLFVEPGRYIEITIKDTGHGISEKIKKNIFNPFFTTAAFGKGTGLGLSIVHRIIKKHNGIISISSEPKLGTSVKVLFPLMGTPVKSEAEKNKKIKILYVEDLAPLRKTYSLSLKDIGYQVTTASDGCEALNIFKEAPEKFDIILTDQMMPNMTGTQLCEEILKIKPDIPIIVATAYSSMSREEIAEIGSRHVIAKPVNFLELECIISSVMN